MRVFNIESEGRRNRWVGVGVGVGVWFQVRFWFEAKYGEIGPELGEVVRRGGEARWRGEVARRGGEARW